MPVPTVRLRIGVRLSNGSCAYALGHTLPAELELGPRSSPLKHSSQVVHNAAGSATYVTRTGRLASL
jgi:hypothetical protein